MMKIWRQPRSVGRSAGPIVGMAELLNGAKLKLIRSPRHAYTAAPLIARGINHAYLNATGGDS